MSTAPPIKHRDCRALKNRDGAYLRAEGHELPDDLIRHISPQIWEHINLTGIYDWRREPQPKGTFRPLRTAKEKF
ncbi:MAG: Tn3 family transposase, partial [Planctomycetaceae bacterium]|nr:Tn3 family transposase [Planctomycetaceae bacterium]